MQGKAKTPSRKRASTPVYVSPNQLVLPGFETPFEQKLSKNNRWVRLSEAIPWDKLVGYYNNLFTATEGRPPINGRVILGTVIIKHLGNLTDRETIMQIQENMYMQYFLGYSSFTSEEPFSDTLFVEIRKRLNLEMMCRINEVVALHAMGMGEPDEGQGKAGKPDTARDGCSDGGAKSTRTSEGGATTVADKEAAGQQEPPELPGPSSKNKGKLLMDATVAPQNITFPTDLKLLNAARKKSEQLIDILYNPLLHGKTKVRTYRRIARKNFLDASKKKRKTSREIYKANGQQLRFLRRNLRHIDALLAAYEIFPLKPREQKYLMVLHTVYEQQAHMHRSRSRRVEHRIVNIHQPHVRPIVRGKENAKTEFGGKLQVSLVDGFTFIDHFSWEAYNEGGLLMDSVEKYRRRFGFYPAEVLADQIYCTRENRRQLKLLDIRLVAKPLGRPSASAVKNHVRPGGRNPIEGKFGQAKMAYGLNEIRAKLSQTSSSWIAAIALVLNLVKLTRRASLSILQWLWRIFEMWNLNQHNIGYNFNICRAC